MKRKSIVALTVASLCLGVLSVGGAVTYAAFSTKKNLDRYTTVKHMIRFQATGTCDWWNGDGAKTAIYIFNSTSGSAGQFANDGAFMESLGGGVYTAPIPPNTDASGATVYDFIIFVRCNSSATIASWDKKWSQTVNIPYDGTKASFILWNEGHGTGCPDPATVDGEFRRSGEWSDSPSTYSYSAA